MGITDPNFIADKRDVNAGMTSALDDVFEKRQSDFEMMKNNHVEPTVDYTVNVVDMPQHSHTFTTDLINTITTQSLTEEPMSQHSPTGLSDHTLKVNIPSTFSLHDDDGNAIVKAYNDGTVEIKQDDKLNEAANMFWREVMEVSPASKHKVSFKVSTDQELKEKDREIERLKGHIESLEYQLHMEQNSVKDESHEQSLTLSDDSISKSLMFDNAQQRQF